GMVIYIATLKGEVADKLRAKSSYQPPLFSYSYGWSFILIMTGFICTEIAGISAVFLYIYSHKRDWNKKDQQRFLTNSLAVPPAPPCLKHYSRPPEHVPMQNHQTQMNKSKKNHVQYDYHQPLLDHGQPSGNHTSRATVHPVENHQEYQHNALQEPNRRPQTHCNRQCCNKETPGYSYHQIQNTLDLARQPLLNFNKSNCECSITRNGTSLEDLTKYRKPPSPNINRQERPQTWTLPRRNTRLENKQQPLGNTKLSTSFTSPQLREAGARSCCSPCDCFYCCCCCRDRPPPSLPPCCSNPHQNPHQNQSFSHYPPHTRLPPPDITFNHHHHQPYHREMSYHQARPEVSSYPNQCCNGAPGGQMPPMRLSQYRPGTPPASYSHNGTPSATRHSTPSASRRNPAVSPNVSLSRSRPHSRIGTPPLIRLNSGSSSHSQEDDCYDLQENGSQHYRHDSIRRTTPV
ncbi:unnamed protein product, partial [Meganyctiphanes norvegica]